MLRYFYFLIDTESDVSRARKADSLSNGSNANLLKMEDSNIHDTPHNNLGI